MWGKVRTKAGLAVVGGALVAVGVGVGSAAALSSPGTQPASDETVVTTPASTSSSEPAPTSQATPNVQQQEQAAPTSSVAVVTSSQQQAPKVEPQPPAVSNNIPEGYNPADQFTDSSGRTYQPAPPAKVEPLPGESGYGSSNG